MATKKTKSLYAESPIKEANVQEMNQSILDNLVGLDLPQTDEDEIEVIDGHESTEHFQDGIVPAGFSTTYGEEITNQTEGQIGQITSLMAKVFDPKDGFRYFLSILSNNRFTIIVPIKFSNMDDLNYAYSHVDARSVTLKPGNVQSQVEAHARRVAQNLHYTKSR